MRRFLFFNALSIGIPIVFSVVSWYVMVLVLGWTQWIALPTCVVVAYFLRNSALKYLHKFLDVRPKRSAEETRHFVTKLVLLYMLIPAAALIGDFLSVKIAVFHPTLAAICALGMASFVTSKHLDRLIVHSNDEHIRGRVLIAFEEALGRSQDYIVEATNGLFWGCLYLPWSVANTHFLVQGVTGSGKTLTIRMLMQSVFRRMKPGNDCRALVYDEKSELYPVLCSVLPKDKLVSLNPHDARCHAWDIAADVTGAASAEEVANLLVPCEEKDHPFFRNAVRTILSLVMESFHRNSPPQWTLRDVLLTMASREKIEGVISQLEGGMERYELVLSKAAAVDTAQNILSTIEIRLRPLRSTAQSWHLSALEGRKMSLTEWIDGEFVLHIGKVEACKHASDTINRILITRAQQLVLDQSTSDTRQTWFFLDEIRGLGKLDGLHDLLNKGRTKGACVVLGFQDVAGMRIVYGKDGVDEICGECHQVALLKAKSTSSATWASEMLGNEEHIEEDLTKGPSGDSKSERIKTRPIVMPEEIKSLPLTGETNQRTGHRNGLSGYYLSEILEEPYKHTIPSSELTARLVPEAKVPERVRRSEDELSLSLWEDADWRRLNLTESPEAEQQDVNLLDLF